MSHLFILMQQPHLCRNRLINWVCACWSQQKDPLDPFNPSHLDSTDLQQHQLLLAKAAELSLSTADNVLANIAHKIPEKELISIFSTKLYLFKCQFIKTLATCRDTQSSLTWMKSLIKTRQQNLSRSLQQSHIRSLRPRLRTFTDILWIKT